MTTPNSFGLVQEDTLPEEDFVRDHIRYVSPLYLERLHIIYDHDAYQDVYREMSDSSSDTPPEPSLGTATSVHPAVKAFFKQANVSTGPVGSGSRVFASYLLDVCDIGPIADRGQPFAEALDSLMHEDDGIDIVFSIAGAPLASVRDALQDGRKDLRLMSIDSALVPELNERFGVKLRGSSFKAKHDGYENASTIGSYAFLVTSKDVPISAVMELLRVLDSSKGEMERNLAVGPDKEFQLEEFPFYEMFRQQNQNFLMELIRNLLIFVVSVSVTTTGALVFLSWVLSGTKNVGHFRKLTKIYTDHLPENTNLDEGTGAFPKPVIYDNQTGIISRLVIGLKELLVLSAEVRRDYDTDGITMTHYEYRLFRVFRG